MIKCKIEATKFCICWIANVYCRCSLSIERMYVSCCFLQRLGSGFGQSNTYVDPPWPCAIKLLSVHSLRTRYQGFKSCISHFSFVVYCFVFVFGFCSRHLCNLCDDCYVKFKFATEEYVKEIQVALDDQEKSVLLEWLVWIYHFYPIQKSIGSGSVGSIQTKLSLLLHNASILVILVAH